MKKFFFVLFVIVSTYAIAEDNEKVCREYSDTAGKAMYARQNWLAKEWFLNGLHQEIEKTENKKEIINLLKHLSKNLVNDAYKEPIHDTEAEKQKAISNFSDVIYQRCMNDVYSLLLPIDSDD